MAVVAEFDIGSRPTVHSEVGAVATSQPLAARAAIELLETGGSAADAAVGAAAVLNVVDPRSTSIGGDAFALCWFGDVDAPTALSGTGISSAGLSVDALRAAGFESMPVQGPWAITVPGSVSAWAALLERYGRLELEQVLAPAIRIAEEGFHVTTFIGTEWDRSQGRLTKDEAASDTFLPGGRAPGIGERFANPDLAQTFRRLVSVGLRDMYEGELASAIAATVQAAGGPLTADDLASWRGAEWVEPIQRRYCGVDVYQLPPPGQGIVLLDALALYDSMDTTGFADQDHAVAESLKLAFADAFAYLADPDVSSVPTEALLSGMYIAERRLRIDMSRAAEQTAGKPSDTVFVAVADAEGGACSLIQSLYHGFGSGICVPGKGMLLQNRGAGFVLDEDHPNAAAPKKRPFHTIIPAMLAQDGKFLASFGVVGGYMQPQGQLQIMRNMFEREQDPQEAVDAPRLRVTSGVQLDLEPHYDLAIRADLEARGHAVSTLERFDAGGAQIVMRTDDGFAAASDPRKDGCAIGR
jgi:gamma-glutamyltranspeptidase / glutathione hydrolase